MPRAASKTAVKQELQRRKQTRALAQLTPELLAGGHQKQLEILRAVLASTDANLILQCSRRAGKTWVCLCILLLVASKTPNVTCIYLGLTAVAAEGQWRVWLRLLADLGIPATHSGMATTLANGSRVEFGGLDDLRHVQSLRGRNLSGGAVVLDEVQSDPGVAETTVVDVLGPMLDEQVEGRPPGLLILAGTIPEIEGVGYFERMWARASEPDSGWLAFNWGRRDNPHEQNFEKNLARYLKKYGYEITHPHVQRTWFGLRAFGDDANLAYGWRPKNSYQPRPPAWLAHVAEAFPPGKVIASELPAGARFLSVGVDPGTRDEATVEAWAWGTGTGAWHVFEWATEKNAGATQGDWAAVLAEIKKRYPGLSLRFVYDAGSSKEVIDTFQKDYGLPAVLPAKKAARRGQVDRFKTLLRRGEAHVMAGTMLERDLQSTRWDLAARDAGKWEFTNHYHPSGSESARYALDFFYEVRQTAAPPKPTNEVEAEAQRVAEYVRERLAQEPKKKPRGRADLWRGPDLH